MTDLNVPDADDPDGAYVEGETPPTDEQVARLGDLEAARAAVAAIEDPTERMAAAKRYHEALQGD